MVASSVSAFDWQAFFDRRGIEYTEHGPSTAKDNLYVHCPFCGEADRGHHMGVSLKGRGWGCWRDSRHRGKAPARLIQALLGVSYGEASHIAGAKKGLSGAVGGVLGAVSAALGIEPGEKAPKRPLGLPGSFQALSFASIQWQYLGERGFRRDEIERLVSRFDLRQTWKDQKWAYRVIIPVYDEQGELVTWTGRSIGLSQLRYRTLSVDPEKEKEPARHPITDCLLDADRLTKGGDFLVVTEGPFDCMRLALEARDFDCRVTCLFGKAISAAQIDSLIRVRDRFKQIFLLLDPDATLDMMRMQSQLSSLRIQFKALENEKDPGELSRQEVRRLLRSLAYQVSDN